MKSIMSLAVAVVLLARPAIAALAPSYLEFRTGNNQTVTVSRVTVSNSTIVATGQELTGRTNFTLNLGGTSGASNATPVTILNGSLAGGTQVISMAGYAAYIYTNLPSANQTWWITNVTAGVGMIIKMPAGTTTNSIRVLPGAGVTVDLLSATNGLAVSNKPAWFRFFADRATNIAFETREAL